MMRFKLSLLNYFVAALAFVAQINPALGQQENGIAVIVTPLALNGRTTYQYRVVNDSPKSIVGLAIGYDYRYGIPELTAYPDGWSAESGIVEGTVLSPTLWTPLVLTTEENPAVELRWRNDGTADVLPGQALSGYAVVVAGQSPQYLTSHWTAFLGDGTVAYGLLAQTGQPRLTLALAGLTPMSPGRFSAQIDITNTGVTTAIDVAITKLIPKSLSGAGTVTVTDTVLPLQVGTILAGAKTTVTVVLSVPASVKRLSLTQQGVLKDSRGVVLNFSAAVSAYTKQ